MFDIVTNVDHSVDHSETNPRCFFRKPTLLRVPGKSRSYVRARSTSLRLADSEVVAGRASHFWMHLTQFDSSQLQRPTERELEDIEE